VTRTLQRMDGAVQSYLGAHSSFVKEAAP